jgi:uncharacterized cupredoxin-like copper-binding protein
MLTRSPRSTTLTALVAAALLATGLAVACGDDGADGGDGPEASAVAVNLTEYLIAPDVDSVPAGSVTFTAMNIGGTDHELVVVRTDLAPDGLPANDDGSVDEAGAGIEVIDEIEEFAPGGEQSLTVDLPAGAYVLLCNIVQQSGEPVSHYQRGMFAAFEVTEAGS